MQNRTSQTPQHHHMLTVGNIELHAVDESTNVICKNGKRIEKQKNSAWEHLFDAYLGIQVQEKVKPTLPGHSFDESTCNCQPVFFHIWKWWNLPKSADSKRGQPSQQGNEKSSRQRLLPDTYITRKEAGVALHVRVVLTRPTIISQSLERYTQIRGVEDNEGQVKKYESHLWPVGA
jgi:hypothetical protein